MIISVGEDDNGVVIHHGKKFSVRLATPVEHWHDINGNAFYIISVVSTYAIGDFPPPKWEETYEWY